MTSHKLIEQLSAEADKISQRAEKYRLQDMAKGLDDEGELYCYLMGKVQGLLDAAAMLK